MRRCIQIAKTSISYSAWLAISLMFSFILLPVVLLPGHKRYDNRFFFWVNTLWCRWFFKSSFTSLASIEGLENIPLVTEQPAIIVINHSSLLDIPLVVMHLKSQPHIWISNDYSKVPLFGFLLKRMSILVKRNSPTQMLSVIKQAYQLTNHQARHLVLFPEGTRHNDGKVHAFFSGFAVLAEKLNRPIIPIAIYGLHKIFPKQRILIDSSASMVKISIGKPIFFDPSKSREAFIAQAHEWMSNEVKRLQASSEE